MKKKEDIEVEIYDPTDDMDDMDIITDDNECSPEEYVEKHKDEVREFMMNIGEDKKKSLFERIKSNSPAVTSTIVVAIVLYCLIIVFLCVKLIS